MSRGRAAERGLLVAAVALIAARRYGHAATVLSERIAELDAIRTQPRQAPKSGSSTERSRRCRANKKTVAATPMQRVATDDATPVASPVAVASAPSLSSPDLGAEKDADKQESQGLSSFNLESENAQESAMQRVAATLATPVAATLQRAAKRRLRSTDERATDKRAAPIPADWQPSAANREFAKVHGLDIELEAYGFRGYFEGQAVKSPNGRFANWLSNAASRKRERGGPSVSNGRAVDGPRGAAYVVVQPPPREA